jgi:GNAT superfamily N-acetyltransferase
MSTKMRGRDWAFVAEDADAYQGLTPSTERDVRPDVVLVHRPGGESWANLACRIRFETATADTSIATARDWFREREVGSFRWLVGPSATPADIASRVIASGAVRDEAEPELSAMVLDREPPVVSGAAVRPVVSYADFEQTERIREAVFGRPPPASVDPGSARRARWAETKATPGYAAFIAEQDGEAVAFGVMIATEVGPMLLAGGVTLPAARGRGAYRALVRARWEAAARAGVPVLVTQAQASSRPILERLGFRPTGIVQVLTDRS